ncbi:MAG: hypothetical protein K0Q79_1662 [Flavipsychrobacter sp.]|jgi:hypothetical protein|nr:hypothetical protein [Flavipsychrobacter sp.]
MDTLDITRDKVRDNTNMAINQEIDRDTEINIQFYKEQGAAEIRARIAELDKEWDIERTLQLNA